LKKKKKNDYNIVYKFFNFYTNKMSIDKLVWPQDWNKNPVSFGDIMKSEIPDLDQNQTKPPVSKKPIISEPFILQTEEWKQNSTKHKENQFNTLEKEEPELKIIPKLSEYFEDFFGDKEISIIETYMDKTLVKQKIDRLIWNYQQTYNSYEKSWYKNYKEQVIQTEKLLKDEIREVEYQIEKIIAKKLTMQAFNKSVNQTETNTFNTELRKFTKNWAIDKPIDLLNKQIEIAIPITLNKLRNEEFKIKFFGFSDNEIARTDKITVANIYEQINFILSKKWQTNILNGWHSFTYWEEAFYTELQKLNNGLKKNLNKPNNDDILYYTQEILIFMEIYVRNKPQLTKEGKEAQDSTENVKEKVALIKKTLSPDFTEKWLLTPEVEITSKNEVRVGKVLFPKSIQVYNNRNDREFRDFIKEAYKILSLQKIKNLVPEKSSDPDYQKNYPFEYDDLYGNLEFKDNWWLLDETIIESIHEKMTEWMAKNFARNLNTIYRYNR